MANFLDGLLSGRNAFTASVASYTQPAVAGTVTIEVEDAVPFAVGLAIFIEVGGSYLITAIPDPKHLTIRNLGPSGNAAPGATVPAEKRVTVAGSPGADGAAGRGVGAVRAVQTLPLTGWVYDNAAGTWTAPANGALPSPWTLFDSVTTPLATDAGFEINSDTGVTGGTLGTRKGIATLTSVGSGGSKAVLTRRSDLSTGAAYSGGVAFDVLDGLVWKGTRRQLTTQGTITLGTTPLAFDQVREKPLLHVDLTKPPYNVRAYATASLSISAGQDYAAAIEQAAWDAYQQLAISAVPDRAGYLLQLPGPFIPCKKPMFFKGKVHLASNASTIDASGSIYTGPCMYFGTPTIPPINATGISGNTNACSLQLLEQDASPAQRTYFNLSENGLNWRGDDTAAERQFDCRIRFLNRKPAALPSFNNGASSHVVSTRGARVKLQNIDTDTPSMHEVFIVGSGTADVAFVRARLRTIDSMNLINTAGSSPPAVTISSTLAMSGSPNITFTFVAPGVGIITRSAGSWTADSFFNGMYIGTSGSTSNNFSAKVTGVSSTQLTVQVPSQFPVINEGPVAGVSVVGRIPDRVPLHVEILSSTTFRYSTSMRHTWVGNETDGKEVHTIPAPGTPYPLGDAARGFAGPSAAKHFLNFAAGTYAAGQKYSTVQTTTLNTTTTMGIVSKYEIQHTYDGTTTRLAIGTVITGSAGTADGAPVSVAQTGKPIQFAFEETLLGCARNDQFGCAADANITADIYFGGIIFRSIARALGAPPSVMASSEDAALMLRFVPFTAAANANNVNLWPDGTIKYWIGLVPSGLACVVPQAVFPNTNAAFTNDVNIHGLAVNSGQAKLTAIFLQNSLYHRIWNVTISGTCNGIRSTGVSYYGSYGNLDLQCSGVYGFLAGVGQEIKMVGQNVMAGPKIPLCLIACAGRISSLSVDNRGEPDCGAIFNQMQAMTVDWINLSDESSGSVGAVSGGYAGGMVTASVQRGNVLDFKAFLVGTLATKTRHLVLCGTSAETGRVVLRVTGSRSRTDAPQTFAVNDVAIAGGVPFVELASFEMTYNALRLANRPEYFLKTADKPIDVVALADASVTISRASGGFFRMPAATATVARTVTLSTTEVAAGQLLKISIFVQVGNVIIAGGAGAIETCTAGSTLFRIYRFDGSDWEIYQ